MLPRSNHRRFLGSRKAARDLFDSILASPTVSAGACVLVRFDDVHGVSHGFADELLSRLSETYGQELRTRVAFLNCSHAVERTLGIVADMHELQLPGFAKSSDATDACSAAPVAA